VTNDDKELSSTMQVCYGTNQFMLVVPLKNEVGHYRVVGVVPSDQIGKFNNDHIIKTVKSLSGVDLKHIHWFSSYQGHHRVADKFQVGRAFLLGDACHIHSPVGGQGMNTGIGDAVNLSWKLAEVLKGNIDPKILDSFETERRSFALKLVSSTDRAFSMIENKSIFGTIFRRYVIPNFFKFISSSKKTQKKMFKNLSQTSINYHGSILSSGTVGILKGGDRLPWVRLNEKDNFEPLKSLDWQIHVYGDVSAPLKKISRREKIKNSRF